MTAPRVDLVDAFELPAWIGEEPVTWAAEDSLGAGHLVAGTVRSDVEASVCDVLAGDRAYPTAVLAEPVRRRMHQEWALGQVLLLDYDDRLTLAAPGNVVDAPLALEALRRFAKAVGAPVDRFSVTLRL